MNGKVGLGFRRDLKDDLLDNHSFNPAFVEFAPENWMNIGGYWKRVLEEVVEKYPVLCHGLSLSIGSPDDLDMSFLKRLKQFLDHNNVQIYSEHLSYSKANNAHLYDLLPIPFRMDAVDHIVERIKTVQEVLERPIALENVSYYTPVAAQMDEANFIREIVERSNCHLLLDVNNIYVNAFNHQYDAVEFLNSLPLNKVKYIHMAGHEQVNETTIIDTHGQPIIDPVYDLFETAIQLIDPVPVLLERDFNIPDFDELKTEMSNLENICKTHWKTAYATT